MKKKIEKLSYEDLKSIKSTFKRLKNDKTKLGISLIDEALFCGESLSKLKEIVQKNGYIVQMDQGNYTIDRENPAFKSYNTTLKNYQSLIKQINDLLLAVINETDKEEKDELEKFVGK